MFGGAKTPQEEITDELWALDLRTLTWVCLFNGTDMDDLSSNMTSLNQEGGGGTSISMVTRASQDGDDGYLPMPVRSHTAHVVGSRMVVLFGYSSREDVFISYVQEYDFGKLCALPVFVINYSLGGMHIILAPGVWHAGRLLH